MSVIEIMAFNLADGVTDSEFRIADSALQMRFAYQQPGIIRRTTGRAEDGAWLVMTLWSSHAQADASDSAGVDDDRVSRFKSMIDLQTVRVKRFDTLD